MRSVMIDGNPFTSGSPLECTVSSGTLNSQGCASILEVGSRDVRMLSEVDTGHVLSAEHLGFDHPAISRNSILRKVSECLERNWSTLRKAWILLWAVGAAFWLWVHGVTAMDSGQINRLLRIFFSAD